MERSEWVAIVRRIRMNWPNSKLPDDSIAKWYDDLRHLPGPQVQQTMESLYREGREFPPNGGQILARLTELEPDKRDHWGEAWRLTRKALYKTDAMAWLRDHDPLAATVLGYLGGNQFSYLNDDEPIVRAQFRQLYEAELDRQHKVEIAKTIPGLEERGGEPKRISDVLPKAIGEEQDDPSGEQEASGDRDPEGAGADDR